MKEIEIKVQIKNETDFYNILRSNGFQHLATRVIHDKYFGLKKSMSNTQRLFRIRRDDSKCTLTMKDKMKDEHGIWTRREINVAIGKDADQMTQILTALGLKAIKENKSKRDVWQRDKTTVEIIEYSIPTKLDLVEIESDSKGKIDEALKLLGNSVKIVGEEIFSVFDKASK
ncbi:class IV adenylate cyclase [Candidatus Dojkabacteria bacterium]|nr:class IV adenylate cyclase [Candidatus Dojkabacteria bacterium]